MMTEIKNAQEFIDSFINHMTKNQPLKQPLKNSSPLQGAIDIKDISIETQFKLSDLFNPSATKNNQYKSLYKGDISAFNNDHSAADLALIGFFARMGLSQSEADKVFRSSRLYRPKWDEMRGDYTYGERTINKAFEGQAPEIKESTTEKAQLKQNLFSDINNFRPKFEPNGMRRRTFIGPHISNSIQLFPANALSALVALGATGKTSILMSIACHVAVGKTWNGYAVERKKVAMFFCEEDKGEITRKFSATVCSWTEIEKKDALDNLLVIPLLGVDARLNEIARGQYKGSGVVEDMIELLNLHGLKDGLVILDHMQGFTSGDLNISETATSISREANKIVRATGSAVVLAAHISKANIKATEIEQGFAVGSLAFENATRQLSGMIPMSEEQAKKFGLQETRKDYVWLGLAKNSYGDNSEGIWLKKVFSPAYSTVVFEPLELSIPISESRLTELQKIQKRVVEYLKSHHFTTKNNLDALSGIKNDLKASKAQVRAAVQSLLNSGEIVQRKIHDNERKTHNLPKQIKEILEVSDSKSAVMNDSQAISKNPSADLGA
jgi:RecA-family ATPase